MDQISRDLYDGYMAKVNQDSALNEVSGMQRFQGANNNKIIKTIKQYKIELKVYK